MVRSEIESDISYPDFKEIDIMDNGLDASAYDINLKNIEGYTLFADRISLGCLTHSVQNIDFSFEIEKIERNI